MLFHDLILQTAENFPDRLAIKDRSQNLTYAELAERVKLASSALRALGLKRYDRVAIYLDKQIETVVSIFGATAAAGISVPCNPLLKTGQLAHIVNDAGCRFLITTKTRYERCQDTQNFHDNNFVVVLVDDDTPAKTGQDMVIGWSEFLRKGTDQLSPRTPLLPDTDVAAILYTSGSTGQPKGVVLSHRNLVAGAESVSTYLDNSNQDIILALLPLSFDAGLSQLTTAFRVGATAVLHNYLMPRDVSIACARHGVTGLTAVPAIWRQLTRVSWPSEARDTLRYFANTGGHMSRDLLSDLRQVFPNAAPFLMYGLTEAFRSTYLPPSQIDQRPDSIGKAIPNTEILVVRHDGTPCLPGEVGELVHKGPLVARGYWNNPELTATKFRPAPDQLKNLPTDDIAVYSGDLVHMDEDGFLYFVGRNDEMIKVGGVRVSPTEIEEVLTQHECVSEAVAFGIDDPTLGQVICACYVPASGSLTDEVTLIKFCRRELATFMVPSRIVERPSLPLSANGKIDRKALRQEFTSTCEVSNQANSGA